MAFTWIGDTHIAIGAMPMPGALPELVREGVTDIVNCRATAQTRFSGDLAIERLALGREHVVCAPMWDHGRPQPRAAFGPAAEFAAAALDDPDRRVLIHCQQGRRRSVLVAYATLRLRGISPDDAEAVLLTHRTVAELVPAYRDSVERWLADRARTPHVSADGVDAKS